MSKASRTAIYGKLAGDSTLTNLLATPTAEMLAEGYNQSIFYQQASSKADFPYVIFSQSSGTPTYTFHRGHAALDDELWMVKGVDRSGSADAADNISDRLDALLTDGTVTISGKTQIYLRRESDLPSYSETVDGQRYIHSGALFRLVYE